MLFCLQCEARGRDLGAPTAAFQLFFDGASPDSVLARSAERARASNIPGVSAYCARCRRVTILSVCTDPQQALIEHELLYRKWHPQFLKQGL